MRKEEILLLFSPILVFLYTFHRFFLEQGIISRQEFWSRVKFFFSVGTSPYKFRSSTPPPGVSIEFDIKTIFRFPAVLKR